MAKNKKNKNDSKKEVISTAKKSFGARPIVWIVLGVLLLVVIVMLVRKDDVNRENTVGFTLEMLEDTCLTYAKSSLRAEFCKYYFVQGELVNCRDQRVLSRLVSEGIDINLGSLNCKGIDVYSYRKDVCSQYSLGTKIADTTCADYQ